MPRREDAKNALDRVIQKSRVHLYKPIQIAEILYRDRTVGDIDLLDLNTYRSKSKKWRDDVCISCGIIHTGGDAFRFVILGA